MECLPVTVEELSSDVESFIAALPRSGRSAYVLESRCPAGLICGMDTTLAFRVVCSDGVCRHEGLFDSAGGAEQFAEHGHCCTARHEIETLQITRLGSTTYPTPAVSATGVEA